MALLPAGKAVNRDCDDHDDSTWDTPLEWVIPETRRYLYLNDDADIAIPFMFTLTFGLYNRYYNATLNEDKLKLKLHNSNDESEKKMEYVDDNFNCNCVFVDKLSPMSVYVSRVKVRTATGWSAWSGIGKPFRTLSPP